MIYLCRHGETAFNREHRLQGQMETDLTPVGERQALAMADLLADLVSRDPAAPWRIVSSPLRRAIATAKAISMRLGAVVEIDRRLIEISLGAWEGRLRSDLIREAPARLDDREWLFSAPGGESFVSGALRAPVPNWSDRGVWAVRRLGGLGSGS